MIDSLKFTTLGDDFFAEVETQRLDNSKLIHVNHEFKEELKLEISDEELLSICSGEKKLGEVNPVSTVYAGHQFGYFVPQLGDGRSCLIGEINNYEVSLKGAGKSPFSRGADGRAVLRSSIREYLCSIAIEALSIPTTKVLALVASDTGVYREHLENASIVTRLAKTHIRFGHFEFFAAQGQKDNVKKLADFVIKHHMPQVEENNYLEFFKEVVRSTAIMIAGWQAQGFAHGVMNTDNMSILGLTIDYGPFSFMEIYNPGFICNHSDTQGRYSFENQPSVALWNLQRLADSLQSIIKEPQLKEALLDYESFLVKEYSSLMRKKFGLLESHDEDNSLIHDFLELLYINKKDYHRTMRMLSTDKEHLFEKSFSPWFTRYKARLQKETSTAQKREYLMHKVNPKYILRNYLAEVAIRKAEDLNEFDEIDILFQLLKKPFDINEGHESYDSEPPNWAQNLELSCSS